MKYAILTGASRGLGAELLHQLTNDGWQVSVISRRELDPVPEGTEVFVADLKEVHSLEGIMDAIMAGVDLERAEAVALVNNAGMLAPVRPIGRMTADEIAENINVNLTAPMVLSSAFIRAVDGHEKKSRIFTVSSGAGKRPIFGWGPYCTVKAGEDMMTRVIGLEQGEQGVRAISFGPGIMDTDMQAQIRSQEPEDFKDVEIFQGFKEEGKLRKPADVAARIVLLLNDPEMEQGGIIDVKDFDDK